MTYARGWPGSFGGVRDVVSFTGFGGQLAICQLHRIMVSQGRRQGGDVGCNWCFRQRAAVNQF